ncbi:hypothetical protein NQ176_g4857 [Zarea fungicola]|uniref:Uncharacterized protein n=1 Tax=Zarea fungicola TaxID=93591 RepID=A0ACC1NCS6_9HYPO|nr:hypothetical protein NQ176_g4857 [Lecanicillium fungicola]
MDLCPLNCLATTPHTLRHVPHPQLPSRSPRPRADSPSQPSPTTAGSPGARGLGSVSNGMGYHPRYNSYGQLPTMGGAVMSNMHQPGSQMSMIPGMSHHNQGYGSQMVYGHAPAPPQSERPFKCDQCIQSFSRNHDLKRHKRIHLAVKPFPCNYCSKSFSRKDALKVRIIFTRGFLRPIQLPNLTSPQASPP